MLRYLHRACALLGIDGNARAGAFVMKILLIAGLPIFVVWPLTVAVPASSNSEQERAYLVIEETTSPNGQCAVAWTLPERPAD